MILVAAILIYLLLCFAQAAHLGTLLKWALILLVVALLWPH